MTLVTNCLRGALAGLILAAASASVEAETAGPVIKGNVIEGVRDARYCEIIPIVRDRLHLEATVYNTLGLNDCPASVWDSITEEAMKQRFGAITVLLNGPRYFLMDSITAEGATKAGEKIDAAGSPSPSAPRSTSACSTCCTEPIARRRLTATRPIS